MTTETGTTTRIPSATTAEKIQPTRDLLWRIVSSGVFAKILVGVVIVAVWQMGMDSLGSNFNYVARPTGIIEAIPVTIAPEWYFTTFLNTPEAYTPIVQAAHERFMNGIVSTMGAIFVGLFIALVAGTIVGVLMGRIKAVDRLLNFYVIAFYAMPMVAIVPVVVNWFGSSGGGTRMAIILFAGFFSITLNMADGARATPPEYLDVAKAYRAKPWNIWFGIAIPAAMPYLLAGIRLAAGRALVGAVIAEMLTGTPNSLGNFILLEAGNLRYNEAFVAVLVLSFFGVGIEVVLNWSTRTFLPWYRREGRGQ